MATTTSTDNSGLLAVLLPAFKARHRIEVRVIAVGTGKAIKHGENGDVDVILVHARAAEEEFVAGGFGVNRRDVMHNDFVILGPAADPAGLKGSKDVAEAFRKLAAARQDFVSRGDDSGTHRKEKALWKDAGVEPSGSWYLSAGQGMGACLTMASEKAAYVMTDRGTYLAYRDKVKLEVLVEGGERLFNPYGVIAVNPDRHPHVEHEAAMTFIDWLTSAEAQKLIAGFKRGGEQLFYPDAVK
jgi:tungstate transport system substrate-binding protein